MGVSSGASVSCGSKETDCLLRPAIALFYCLGLKLNTERPVFRTRLSIAYLVKV